MKAGCLFQKGITIILFIFFLHFNAQKITIVNKSNNRIFCFQNNIKYEVSKNKEFEINIFSETIITDENKIIINLINFLEPKEQLKIEIHNDGKFSFDGDKKKNYEYIYGGISQNLQATLKKYVELSQKGDLSSFINFSELALINHLKMLNLTTVFDEQNDSIAQKNLKQVLKYRWLGWLFLVGNTDGKSIFFRNIVNYYFSKYIKRDIESYSCNSLDDFLKYNIIETIVKLNSKDIKLPIYPIVKSTEYDSLNKYLHKSCQQAKLLESYSFNLHKKNPKYKLYKEILINDFGMNKDLIEKYGTNE
ncbi:hypothetical protein [Chryseobacterium sp. POE27]|uniref:hypothetical protein n=1 Tax=Chryseobacterium sp. POE27 TaxID=3138177 RepID=UPI0032196ADF